MRGVETIEEFFRPQFAHNTQSLNGVVEDSDVGNVDSEKNGRFDQFSDDSDDIRGRENF